MASQRSRVTGLVLPDSGNARVWQIMQGRTREELNLSVLKRFDSAIQQVLGAGSHVALYDFNLTESKWDRKDVEGSLFFVRRSEAPTYQLFIMNKKSTDNHREPVTESFTFEVQSPYLIYRSVDSDTVTGIWFYEPQELVVTEGLINHVKQELAAQREAQPQALLIGAASTDAASRPETQPARPQLLTPGFFKQAEAAQEAPQPPSQLQQAPATPPAGNNAFQAMLAKAVAPKQAPQPAAAQTPPAAAAPITRERVRAAMTRLLANDSFIDMIAQELEQTQL